MNDKRGIVLLYVLIFMVLSQVIYWGMLKLNQVNLSRYSQFQSYYASRIHEQLARNLFGPQLESDTELIESQILDELYYNRAHLLPEEKVLIEGINLTIRYRQIDASHEVIRLITTDVYIPETLIDKASDFNTLCVTGLLTDTGKQVAFTNSQIRRLGDAFENLSVSTVINRQLLEEEGFSYVSEKAFSIGRQLSLPDLPITTITSNLGQISYWRTKNRLNLKTELNDNHFVRTHKAPPFKRTYKLLYKEIIFQRTMDPNNSYLNPSTLLSDD